MLTTAEIQQKVKEYNAQINSNLFMNMVRWYLEWNYQAQIVHFVVAVLSYIFFPFNPPSEQGCILHRFHKGPVQAGTSSVSSISKERRSWCWREEGQWSEAPHLLLPAKGCIQTFAHKFTYFCSWGHWGLVEKVHGGGQSWQVCTVWAQRASWSR